MPLVKRPYSHLPRITDPATRDLVRILYDRIGDLEERLQVKEGPLTGALGTNLDGARFRAVNFHDPIDQQDLVTKRYLETRLFAIVRSLAQTNPNLPGGPITPTNPPPFYFQVVADYAAANPAQLANSCQGMGGTWDFMDGVVAALRAIDMNFAFNGKRGNIADPSQDAISYYWGTGTPTTGSSQVHVIDIIAGHCGTSPQPAWQIVAGPGAYLFPRP